MTALAVWAVCWLLMHRLLSGSPARAFLVRLSGERLFRLAFAVLSIVVLAGLSHAYWSVKPDSPTIDAKLVIFVALMQVFAAFLIVGGLTTRNPTTAGMGEAVYDPNVVRGVIRVTRHPFLCGVLIWSLGHLLMVHDTAALIFFGSIALVAAIGMASIDKKRRDSLGENWCDFEMKTSIVPFWAILSGRQNFKPRELGAWRMAAAVLIWLCSIALHPGLSLNVIRYWWG